MINLKSSDCKVFLEGKKNGTLNKMNTITESDIFTNVKTEYDDIVFKPCEFKATIKINRSLRKFIKSFTPKEKYLKQIKNRLKINKKRRR
jgi:hypothetical protein